MRKSSKIVRGSEDSTTYGVGEKPSGGEVDTCGGEGKEDKSEVSS